MRQMELRNVLINGTVHVIANEGFDKATTKRIGQQTKTNEAYIYRCFKGKEDMFQKTFDSLDEELTAVFLEGVSVMYMSELDYEVRCRLFFTKVWDFMLSNREKCLAYVRYYYSPYFPKLSADTHKQRCAPVVKSFRDAFREEADVWMILNHIMNVMLDFAVKVHHDHMPDNDDYSEHVFRVVYRSVEQYFKREEVLTDG